MWKITNTIRRDATGDVWYRLIEKGDAAEHTCDDCRSRIRGIMHWHYAIKKICRACAAHKGWEW
jgi:hypothetical protein